MSRPTAGRGKAAGGASGRRASAGETTGRRASSATGARTGAGVGGASTAGETGTALQRCVRDELERHFALLDGEPPSDLYRMVMQQVESSLIDSVLQECGGNRSRAAVWLGISRGTLRGKLSDPD